MVVKMVFVISGLFTTLFATCEREKKRMAFSATLCRYALHNRLLDRIQKYKDRWPRPAIMLPLCVSLVCIGMALGTTTPFFDWIETMRVGSFGVCALGLFLMALTLQANRSKAPKWLVLTGDASYSLYLLRTFLLSLAGLFRFNPLQGNATLILLFSVLMPVGITLLSIVWFKYLEYPLMRRVLHK